MFRFILIYFDFPSGKTDVGLTWLGILLITYGVGPLHAQVSHSTPSKGNKDLSDHWRRISPLITCANESDNSCFEQVEHYWEVRLDSRKKLKLAAGFDVDPGQHAVSKRATEFANCQDALENYGAAASDFIGCSVNFSRPILLCEKCVESFLHAREAFMEYDKTKDENGLSCDDIVYGSDLIEVVHRANKTIESLWGDSHCAYCFDSYYIKHGTVIYQFSENLMTFIHKHQNLTDCFVKHGVIVNMQYTDMANLTNTSLVCRECYPYYKDLSDFFLKNYTQDITKTCMDVIDVMNQTRRMWGHWFQCEDRHPSMFLPWTVAIVVFAMTIVFYIGMFFNSSFEYYVIRKQDRLDTAHFVAINNQLSQSNPDLSYSPL